MKVKKLLFFILFLNISVMCFPEAVSISFSSGYFLPKQKEFKEIYGNGYPLAFEIRINLWKNSGFSAGLEYLNRKGYALGNEENEYPLRFKMTTIPFTVFYRYPLKRAYLSVGLGASYNTYEERWERVEIEFNDEKWGYFIFYSAEYRIFSKFYLLAHLRYENISTGEGSFLVEDVSLGGMKILAGFSIHLF